MVINNKNIIKDIDSPGEQKAEFCGLRPQVPVRGLKYCCLTTPLTVVVEHDNVEETPDAQRM